MIKYFNYLDVNLPTRSPEDRLNKFACLHKTPFENLPLHILLKK